MKSCSMVRLLLLLFAFCLPTMGYSQLNCKTEEKQDSTITRCYHSNKKISTKIAWDKNQRQGNAKAWDSKGNKIIDYSLRRYAGHESVYFQYHPNGQIRKAEYSSAPDGGIQFYRMIHSFDEDGNHTHFSDLSQPDGKPEIMVPKYVYDPEKLRRPSVLHPEPPEPAKETVRCAIPYHSVFVIENQSGRKVSFNLNALPNKYYTHKTHCCISLSNKHEFEVYRITMAEMYLPASEAFELIFTPKGKKKTNFRVVEAVPTETDNTKTYRWIILRQ